MLIKILKFLMFFLHIFWDSSKFIFTYFTLKAFFKFLMLFGWFIFSKEGLDSFGDLIRFKGDSPFSCFDSSVESKELRNRVAYMPAGSPVSTDVSFNCFRESSRYFPCRPVPAANSPVW